MADSSITLNYGGKVKWIILAFVVNAALFALGVWTWVTTETLHLPLPVILPALGTLLPLINFGGTWHALSQPSDKIAARPLRSGLPAIIVLVFDTMLLALSGSKLHPAACEFHDKWQGMFQTHDMTIAKIQNKFSCCGFKKPHDMPFPFPAKGINVTTCEVQTGRNIGCADAWEKQEGLSMAFLFAVGGVLVVWKVLSLVIIQRNADKALRMKEAEDEEQRGRIEEVDESDEEDAAGGGSLGRASPPEATETTPLMLEGVGNAWENEGLNGRQREQQERERRPVGN